jgi:hypothetical protein
MPIMHLGHQFHPVKKRPLIFSFLDYFVRFSKGVPNCTRIEQAFESCHQLSGLSRFAPVDLQ